MLESLYKPDPRDSDSGVGYEVDITKLPKDVHVVRYFKLMGVS